MINNTDNEWQNIWISNQLFLFLILLGGLVMSWLYYLLSLEQDVIHIKDYNLIISYKYSNYSVK